MPSPYSRAFRPVGQFLMCLALSSLLATWGTANDRIPDSDSDPPRQRTFELTYGCSLEGLPLGARLRVWWPAPQSNAQQDVQLLAHAAPATVVSRVDPVYGNEIRYFQLNRLDHNGVVFSSKYRIVRRELRALDQDSAAEQSNDRQRQLFLRPNVYVPLQGKHLTLLQGIQEGGDELSLARALYDRVDQHMRYDKSRPGYGNGDVLWACDSQFGNCTDFHSLFISWARAKGLPAKFEIGFPLPPERGLGTVSGYHCWAFFQTRDGQWIPVDISEADKQPELKDYYFGNLTENRVAFTTGRDIQLLPRPTGKPLNYFIFPYAEVDGKPLANDQVRVSIEYTDLPRP